MKPCKFENETTKLYIEVTEENKYKVVAFWKLLNKYRIYEHNIFENAVKLFYDMVRCIIIR